VVIDDLNSIRIAIAPDKADTPLIIYPDTVLSLSRPFQRLKPVGRWHLEVIQLPCVVQHSEFSAGNNLDIHGELSRNSTFPDLSVFLVLELPDHACNITQCVISAFE
jgi:hypothetical protein